MGHKKRPTAKLLIFIFYMAPPAGLEPATH
jgi:hypothetical protein